jgi:hypothetical protein
MREVLRLRYGFGPFACGVDDCTRPGGKPCGFVLIEESVIVSPPAVRRQVPGSEALVELDPHPRGLLFFGGCSSAPGNLTPRSGYLKCS